MSLLGGCEEPRAQKASKVWRFAIEETQGSVQHAYATRFAELVEARTGGEVSVIIYPYGALGTSDEITEQLHSGTLNFAMASPGHLGTLIPELQAFLLHFLLSENERVNKRALRDPAVIGFLEALYEEKGLRFLSIFSEGWMAWTTKTQVRRPQDFRGQKFRVMTSPLLLAAYEAYGASPTPLPYSEVYSALQLNMIDGQVNPVFAIEEMSFYEVTDWLIFPRHAQFYTTLAANPRFFDRLSSERRRLVHQIVEELHDYIFDVQRRFNEERLERIENQKPGLQIIALTEEERGRFREASKPVREAFEDLAGPRGRELLDTLAKAVARAESLPEPAGE
jgi:tripartite ATP-independent transporter DctP family solute receptor